MLKSLFGTRNETAPVPPPLDNPFTLSPEGIRYDPELIDELKTDHGHLVGMFQQITRLTAERDGDALIDHLHEFGHLLHEHLIKENVRFYVYLKNSLGTDQAKLATAQNFAREMRHIGRAVTDFLQRHSSLEHLDEAHWPAFEAELKEIGKVLIQRIEAEESTLYALYRPS